MFACLRSPIHTWRTHTLITTTPSYPLPFSVVLINDFNFPRGIIGGTRNYLRRGLDGTKADPAPSVPQILLSACQITTPLSLPGWHNLLRGYPNQAVVHFFLRGISEGFRIEYNYKEFTCKPTRRNLLGAVSHPEVVDRYL